MDSAFWLAALAYLLPTFPLGYFWHLRTFRARYERLEVYRQDMIIPFGLASMALQALLFAWLYPRLFSTAPGDWVTSALQFGGTFGLLGWTFAILPAAAKYRMTSVREFLVLETAFTAVHFGITAPLIALAYRGSV